MNQPNRLPDGGRIDRASPCAFEFDGRRHQGFEGDTLASALLANGVSVVRRSFKFHRPRGVLSAGVEEPHALVEIQRGGATEPIIRATLVPLAEGLVARSHGGFPSVRFDLGRVLDATRWMWPAGFYNKTFKWPSWRLYESAVRRAAGLGRLPRRVDTASYHHHNRHCDALVIGGGAAGLTAALAAGRAGARVVLVEQDRLLGGRLLFDATEIDGAPSAEWLAAAEAELRRLENVSIMTSAVAAGYYDHNVLTVVDESERLKDPGRGESYWKFRARQVVLATGAIEQPLVFPGNDRPGIMLAGAVRAYLHRYAVVPGRPAVVVTNNDSAWCTAFDLRDRGIAVNAIVDVRSKVPERLAANAAGRGIPSFSGAVVTGTDGSSRLRAVRVRELTADGTAVTGKEHRLQCDLLAMSGGWSPTVHLYSQAGGRLRYRDDLACFVPERCRQAVQVVGAAAGDFALGAALAGAVRAATTACEAAGFKAAGEAAPSAEDHPTGEIRPLRRVPGADPSRQWIDFLHDVTVADLELAVRENFVSVEHLKRYTTTGMAADQGKTSNLNALGLLAELTGKPIPQVGTTTFRPQFMPVPLGAIAGSGVGDFYAPARRMPVHAWHVANGAELEDYGQWKRPACYRRGDEDREQAIRREVLGVRRQVGLCEGSPLGKIEVKGPDAAGFLNRMYVNNVLSLKPGRVRYGLMLNENGTVIDDGVFARMGDEHYLVSTTAAQADRIAAWLEEWYQCEWPHFELVLSPVTSQWAVLTLAGPESRKVVQTLDSDIDFSPEAFPHMHLRTGTVHGVPARVQRVSFSGELSYEISVPADHAEALWDALMQSGESAGIVPVGIEALLILRMEKGHLHVGTDTEGTTNPLDLGMGRIIEKKTGDFIGRRSLQRPNDLRSGRRQFVGVEPADPQRALIAGAHFITGSAAERRSEGFLTSACLSPTLGRYIGLGLLERGLERMGETVTLFDQGETFGARVVAPAHYDPQGERARG